LKPATCEALADEHFRMIEVPYRPTAENFAKAFYDALREQGLPVLRVTVYETPDNSARYEV
ncbi:MAG: 6-carboxytetrahydropterin synthase, partial [Oscillospiraceae bacterium]|nr:6-carboxytetrahydropterin synthase [Oscillospiraceae bacterium]